MTEKEQIILDACCGSRMFHFDKNNKNVIFMDNRDFEECLKCLKEHILDIINKAKDGK